MRLLVFKGISARSLRMLALSLTHVATSSKQCSGDVRCGSAKMGPMHEHIQDPNRNDLPAQRSDLWSSRARMILRIFLLNDGA